jgi:hypothetical protein
VIASAFRAKQKRQGRDNVGVKRSVCRKLALLAAYLLVLGSVTALTGCGGSTQTTTVTKRVKVRVRSHPGQNYRPSANGPPVSQRKFEVRTFPRDAPKELRSVSACLTNAGFSKPSLHPNAKYAGTGPYASAKVNTDAGWYEVAIFPTAKKAYVYAYQLTSAPGASQIATHASYYGRVALVSTANTGNGGAVRGQESHAYFAERSAVARCAFAIPAARGHPAVVY